MWASSLSSLCFTPYSHHPSLFSSLFWCHPCCSFSYINPCVHVLTVWGSPISKLFLTARADFACLHVVWTLRRTQYNIIMIRNNKFPISICGTFWPCQIDTPFSPHQTKSIITVMSYCQSPCIFASIYYFHADHHDKRHLHAKCARLGFIAITGQFSCFAPFE